MTSNCNEKATINVAFKVKSRYHINGIGYVTVIHNPDLLHIDCDKSVICKGQLKPKSILEFI